MAMYNLPADVKWPQQLAGVIRSYQMGRALKQQKEQQQAQMKLEAMKEQREAQKAAADIKMKQAYMALLKSLVGGGRVEGPPEEDGVLPGLEEPKGRISGWGPGGPRVDFEKPKTQMDLIRDIAALAKQISDLDEGSPQKKLAITTLTKLRGQLAEMQGQEVRETKGLERPFKSDIPAKVEVVPKGTPPILPPKPSNWLEKAGVGNIGGELKKAYFPTGTWLDKTKKQKYPPTPTTPAEYNPNVKPKEGQKLKMPPRPKEPKEAMEWYKVISVWDRLPTSVQWEIWNYTQSGQLTFAEVMQSDELKRYANTKSNSRK